MTTPNAIAPAAETRKSWELLPAGKAQISALLNDPEMRKKFNAALPKLGVTPERLLQLCMNQFQTTPRLLECTPMSVIGGIMKSFAAGLELGGVMAECHMVPFKDGKDGGKLKATFMVGYPGWITLCHRSGKVSSIDPRVVHRKDRFKITYGTNAGIVHVPFEGPGTSPESDDPGAVRGVYVVVTMTDGTKKFEYMTLRELESIRKQSKNGDGEVWTNHPERMYVKTVIIRSAKSLPKSAIECLRPAIRAEVAMESGTPIDGASVLFGDDDLIGGGELTDVAETPTDATPPKRRTRGAVIDAKPETKADPVAELIAIHEKIRSEDPEAFGMAWKIANVKGDWAQSVAPFSLLGWIADQLSKARDEANAFIDASGPLEPKK